MESPASEIARRLGDNAEAVCRRYLSNGRREGHYWLVGDVHNTPGRSLFVRLGEQSDGRGPAGKWTDAASGEHGDLLDVIAAACGHASFRETLAEARRFLSLPLPQEEKRNPSPTKARRGTAEAARRLWAASKTIAGSPGAACLAKRLIVSVDAADPLRYHPQCFYRPSRDDPPGGRPAWPAIIAAVTDLAGGITGVHRTWFDPETMAKAPVACPRRAMGNLLGNGVRFGAVAPVMAAGEGLETILSLREAVPAMPMIAGLSGAHLAALEFPPVLQRLYVACDADPAGTAALASLAERAADAGIAVLALEPRLGDFNDDLVAHGRDALVRALRAQFASADRSEFL
ncbi:toprim domain-containing protein [Sphingopyxis sp. JAI108]|uniref:DUF7146 domain-containing protein n=1 Tax=Sphingopyxis sp. JAI108 TaxID=2723060 RepID=UPI0015CCEB7A|nr:toprim domain-containing protein [Sphingopyxis sp. JAI108]NYF33626.1 hypothetical protein [Sphingopyxis sp. JAI108]